MIQGTSEQSHFGRTLDDVIIGNQITIVRDENTVPVRPFVNTLDPFMDFIDVDTAPCGLARQTRVTPPRRIVL
jgi:hypothetical protein